MILLDRVTKNYGKNNKPALNRASIHVGAGEFVIIVGTSGAGKSTLLKLLTREEKPSSGKIVVGGIDYDNLKDKHIPLLRRKIGVVFQDFKLLPNRTVFENVAFALEIAGMTNHEIKATVPKVIKLVGLEGKEGNSHRKEYVQRLELPLPQRSQHLIKEIGVLEITKQSEVDAQTAYHQQFPFPRLYSLLHRAS